MGKKKNFEKITIRRAWLLLCAFVVTLSSLLTLVSSVFALESSPVDIKNIKSNYDNAARAEHAAYKIYQCAAGEGGIHIGGSGWWTDYWGDGYNYDTVFSGGLWYYESIWSAVGLHSLSAGRWLEEKVQGKFDDGKIDCGDNDDRIIDVFAGLIGKTRADVICGKNGAPGLMKNADGGACSTSVSTDSEFIVNPDWQTHLASLYDEYIKSLDYPVTWAKLSGNSFVYSDIDGYYLYSLEIEKGCGGSLGVTKTASDAPAAAHSPTPLKRLDSYGNTTYEWFAGKDGKPLSEAGFVSRADGWTCKQYIERANSDDLYGKFRALILNNIKKGCYEARKTQIAEAQEKFNEVKDDLTDEERSADEDVLKKAKGLLADYETGKKDALVEQYKDDDGNTGDGLMCKVIDGLADVGMAAYEIDNPDPVANNDPTCMSAAGTALGWILCPVMEALGGAVDWVYNDMVKPALHVEPQLFSETNATRDAWEKFRNIANILFILFLLAVIFSQLTGYGIDNYGIKKILPKLIIGALLMNLSYFICVALVDVSNILGSSLQNLFTGLKVDGMLTEVTGNGYTVSLGDIGTGVLTFVTILATLVVGIGAAILASGGGVAFLIGLLISGLGVVISILFLFLLLAAREAAIVVLVVLSPLAWACFILPNTKNLFDKWWKLGWKLLMVYPIAGVLIGGGDYVSRLLLAAGAGHDGFFPAFAAMAVGIVPILAIPTVLKSSFAMMGNLGAKLSGMGKNLGGRLTGNADKAWKGSEGYKSRQDTFARNRQARSAERTQRRLNRRIDNGRTLSRGQQERLARANEAILERDKRNAENRVRATAGYVDAVRAKQELDIEQSAQDTLLYGNGDYVNAQRTKAENARTAGMAEAEVGVLGINQELARQRAMSSRKAQEMKNYSDQYSALGRSEMGVALTNAVSAYNANRNEQTAMQLAAAVAAANGMGMNKEALNSLGGLRLSAKNANDSMVLNQMAASNNKVLSQFAKSRSKNDTAEGAPGVSIDDFITSTVGGDSLASSFAAKGTEVANGMDDDTLGYLSLHGGSGALSTETLVNAANATSNQKEIDEINKMLATRTDYSMRTRDLDKLKLSTLDKLGANDTLYRAAVNEIRANMDSPEVQRILNGMDRDVRTRLGLS